MKYISKLSILSLGITSAIIASLFGALAYAQVSCSDCQNECENVCPPAWAMPEANAWCMIGCAAGCKAGGCLGSIAVGGPSGT